MFKSWLERLWSPPSLLGFLITCQTLAVEVPSVQDSKSQYNNGKKTGILGWAGRKLQGAAGTLTVSDSELESLHQ